eukprot:CAMPEP_0171316596 /NCGR_PEP_ID=MMETSP0816-20121228/74171_1 /TAXON_ID=420281 /ORGANISM="Proboscia inermis, Strain CCAP1064/1" /LENGTH=37 /DNA_ID= /DNA_START= /DNA_END= /DNA_ORIENTATION=
MEICGNGKTPGTQDGNGYRNVRNKFGGRSIWKPPTKT